MDGTGWFVVIVAMIIVIGLAYWLIAGGKKDDEHEEKDKRPDEKKARTPSAASRRSDKDSGGKKADAKKADAKKAGSGKASADEAKKAGGKKSSDEGTAAKKNKGGGKKAATEASDTNAGGDEDVESRDAEKTSEAKTSGAEKADEREDEKSDPAEAEEKAEEQAGDEEAADEAQAGEVKAEEPPPAKAEDDEAEKAARKERRKALRKGLKSTRGGFIAKLGSLLKGKKVVDPDLLEKIEEILLTADVGVQFTDRLIASMKETLSGTELTDPDVVWEHMRDQAHAILTPEAGPWDIDREHPFVIMVIGVNGVGKTTTIAKLASRYAKSGKKVVLAAGDTFRAAAVRQLEMWGQRVGAEVVKKDKQGADPSAVVFDAIERGLEVDADVIIADTAGRLHTKTPLMDELKKVKRVMDKAHAGAPHEVLLVLDSNTGQNAIVQTREFQEALGVTGIVLTKLDGTAKGGVILGICEEHKLPVRFIGVGERDDDLREFDADDFVSVLFENPEDANESAA